MPRIKQTEKSQAYKTLRSIADSNCETNDCAVIAIALTTGVGYEAALAACTKHGRKTGKGTPIPTMKAAVKELGFKVVEVNPALFISRYPGNKPQTVKNVTNHHPERFHKVWKDGNNYILITARHAAAALNGELHDWSKGRALRCRLIWKIVPVDTPVQEYKYEVTCGYTTHYGEPSSFIRQIKATNITDAKTIILHNLQSDTFHRAVWVESITVVEG